MSFDPPVAIPAGYLTGQAIAYISAADHGVLVSPATPLPVDPVARATATDRGAVVGIAATTLMPANPARRGFVIQNQSASATVYLSVQGAATTDWHSLMLPPGAIHETPAHHVGTGAISIISTAAATPVHAREF